MPLSPIPFRSSPGALIAGLVLLAACSGEEEPGTGHLPPPGNLDSVLARYTGPTGQFDSNTIETPLCRAKARIDGLLGAGFLQELVTSLEDAFAAADEAEIGRRQNGAYSPARQLQGTTAQGYIQTTTICPGHTNATEPDAARDGSFSFYINFTEDGVLPLAWGDIDDCHISVGDRRLVIQRGSQLPTDGTPLLLHVGDGASFDGFSTLTLTFGVDLRVVETTADAGGDETTDLALDFQIERAGDTGWVLKLSVGDPHVRACSPEGNLVFVFETESLAGLESLSVGAVEDCSGEAVPCATCVLTELACP